MSATKKPAHPNKAPFQGVLTHIGVPSDKAPSGARAHRVVLTRQAAEDALESLEGMGLGFTAEWDGHDARRKCGVITKAWIEGDEIHVTGHVYVRDFPEIAQYLSRKDADMGMSYELADANVANMRAEIWEITSCTFTGAAVLLRSKAAYGGTRFNLTASAHNSDSFTGKLSFIDRHQPTGRLHIRKP